jgi:hypothetical protein
MISWLHARLTEEPGGVLTLEDLGSTNGTAVQHAGAPATPDTAASSLVSNSMHVCGRHLD